MSVALVDCLDTRCKIHLKPYSVNQSPDQLFLRHSIWWYHPPTYIQTQKAKKMVSRLRMMPRTVSVLKLIAIDAGNKYDFTLFSSTVTQRFFEFYLLKLINAFSLIRGKKLQISNKNIEHDRNGNRFFRLSSGFTDVISFNMCLSFSHFAHPGINKISEPWHSQTLLLILDKKVIGKI